MYTMLNPSLDPEPDEKISMKDMTCPFDII